MPFDGQGGPEATDEFIRELIGHRHRSGRRASSRGRDLKRNRDGLQDQQSIDGFPREHDADGRRPSRRRWIIPSSRERFSGDARNGTASRPRTTPRSFRLSPPSRSMPSCWMLPRRTVLWAGSSAYESLDIQDAVKSVINSMTQLAGAHSSAMKINFRHEKESPSKDREQHAALLYEASKLLGAPSNLKSAMDALLTGVLHRYTLSTCLLLTDSGDGVLRAEFSLGVSAAFAQSFHGSQRGRIHRRGVCLRSSAPDRRQNGNGDDPLLHTLFQRQRLSSALIVPLKAEGRVLGAAFYGSQTLKTFLRRSRRRS